MGLAQGPGLLLMHSVATGVGIVVAGDLGQGSGPATAIALVGDRPGQVLAGWAGLPGGIGRQRNGQGAGARRGARGGTGMRHYQAPGRIRFIMPEFL